MRTKKFSGLLAIAATCGGTSVQAQDATPESVAAAYATIRHSEQRIGEDMQLLSGYALTLADSVTTLAQSIGNANQPIPPTLVTCDVSGSVTITKTYGALYWLRATFESCVTREPGWEMTRQGSVTLTLAQVVASTPRILAIRIGDSNSNFVEERQIFPTPPDALPPTRSTVNYTIAGDLMQLDEFHSGSDSDYHYAVEGSFSEQSYAYTARRALHITTFTIDGDDLLVRGSRQSIPGEDPKLVTSRLMHSGVLIHDYSEEVIGKTPTFEFGRTSYRFDDLKTRRIDYPSTGMSDLSYNGFVDLSLPDWVTSACTRGPLRLETLESITETGQNTQEFTKGVLRTNGGEVRFSSSAPNVVVTAPGFEPVTFDNGDSLFGFSGCFF